MIKFCLFWESKFIDQAALNGTRPNSTAGAKPATSVIEDALSSSVLGTTLNVDPPAVRKRAALEYLIKSVASEMLSICI
jgi:hypothetical protein